MKVAKLIEQLMKLGAENEMTNAQFSEERQVLQKNIEDAKKLSAEYREKASDVEHKYSKSLEMMKSYQHRLRALAEEREHAFQESRRAKLEQETCSSREKMLENELREVQNPCYVQRSRAKRSESRQTLNQSKKKQKVGLKSNFAAGRGRVQDPL